MPKYQASLKTIALFTSFLCVSFFSSAVSISMENIKNDVTFLASDKLKGRYSFTPELDNAANYIASRFKAAGLKPFKQSYLQKFPIYSFKPLSISLEINGIEIPAQQLALASTAKQLHWSQDSDVTITYISEGDKFRPALAKLNQTGGDHLVLVHSSHQDIFNRYKQYFNGGITKLNSTNQGSMVIALSNLNNVQEFSASGQSDISNKILTNVVGVLPGKSKPSEVILYSAHYDHLGTREADGQQDNIFNGADDNASGTTAIINLAQYFSTANSNERTLVFSAFTAEEIGGYGSQYFSQHIPAENIMAMINIEMIGKASKFGSGVLWMTGAERSNLIDILNDSLRKKQSKIHHDPYPKEQLFYRSDNATLARLGVPAHSFSTTQLDKDEHYHKTSDEISTINFSSMKRVIESLAIATESLTNGTATPTRIDTSKVRSSGKIY
jgi:aminopeptidase YwaD